MGESPRFLWFQPMIDVSSGARHAACEDKHGLMETLMRALDERKVTSWFAEHDVDIVTRYATRVAAWIAGRVAADGAPTEVLANEQVRREILGTA